MGRSPGERLFRLSTAGVAVLQCHVCPPRLSNSPTGGPGRNRHRSRRYYHRLCDGVSADNGKGFSFWTWTYETVRNQWWPPSSPPVEPVKGEPESDAVIHIKVPAYILAEQLYALAPKIYPAPPDELKDQMLNLPASSDAF